MLQNLLDSLTRILLVFLIKARGIITSFVYSFPHRYKTFFIQHVSLNARVSGYLNLKFHNLSPFGGFLGVFMQKGIVKF